MEAHHRLRLQEWIMFHLWAQDSRHQRIFDVDEVTRISRFLGYRAGIFIIPSYLAALLPVCDQSTHCILGHNNLEAME